MAQNNFDSPSFTPEPVHYIQQAPSAPGQSGKGPSSMGALMTMIDPAGGKMFGAV